MHRVVIRQLALLLFVALCPALALAASETYEGQLVARNNDAPIAIVLQMEEMGGFLTGTVKTSHPLKGNATIDSGRNVAGFCNLASALSASVTLRLYGSCNSTSFEGNYTIYDTQSRSVARGTFRLTRKIAESGKAGSGPSSADVTASNMVACVKANTRCLTACPRGDSNVEYLCANHCRTKLQACKGKASKIESDPE